MSEMSKSQMLIGGEWLPPASKDYFESFNPYTGKPWKLIARGDAEDADRAVEAAYQAFHNPDWRNLTATARGHLLRRLGDLIAEHAEPLARTEVQDNGKLFAEMHLQLAIRRSGITTMVAWLTKSKGLCCRSKSRTLSHLPSMNRLVYVLRSCRGIRPCF